MVVAAHHFKVNSIKSGQTHSRIYGHELAICISYVPFVQMFINTLIILKYICKVYIFNNTNCKLLTPHLLHSRDMLCRQQLSQQSVNCTQLAIN